MRLLGDRILVKRLDPEEVMRNGIVIPDIAQDKSMEAKVVSVGPGQRYDSGIVYPIALTEGDTVLIGKYAGSEFKLKGHDHLVVREDEVLAVL